jgi:hypothetical protein
MSGRIRRRARAGCLWLGGFQARRPGVVATRMEMQQHHGTVKLGFDLVLNIRRANQYPTEIAGDAASFAAPHSKGYGSSQGSHIQPGRPWLPCGRDFVRRWC